MDQDRRAIEDRHVRARQAEAARVAELEQTQALAAFGNPAEARSMNFEGMRRRGFSAEAIAALRRAYKVVYRQGLTVEQALAELAESAVQFPEVAVFRDSVQASTRGITR